MLFTLFQVRSLMCYGQIARSWRGDDWLVGLAWWRDGMFRVITVGIGPVCMNFSWHP